MSARFDAQSGLIVIPVVVDGPSASAVLRLALDTGATGTLINTGLLVALGYDPELASNRIQVTTGSGVEYVPIIALHRLYALGKENTDFPVLAHTLPPSAGVDGLLGLDFLRNRILTADFCMGIVALQNH